MFSKSLFVTAAMLGVSAVKAHMIMTEPVPYGKSTLNNSPLAADGSDFPCKLRSNTYEISEWNKAKVGESMPLTFQGSATHGGGSCQISLTTDLEPTSNTEWMVIKSFEGGCPANVDGNLSGGPTTADPYTFNYTVPDGISPGKYTLAWTWFNRIGNREMYMNCAPLEVESSSSKRSVVAEKRSSSFPPLFVANINNCMTSEGVDIRFPQPGDDVVYEGEPSNLASAGAAACTGTPTFGAAGDTSSGSSGSGSGSSGSSASAVVTAAPVTTDSDTEPTTWAAGAVATTKSAAPAVNTASSSSLESSGSSSGSSSGAGSGSSPNPSPSTVSSSSSSSGSLSGSCTVEGEWNCINGSSFQRCANGQWSQVQDMAAGTQCTAGQSSNLAISAAKLMPRTMKEGRSRRHGHGGHVHA
ncbi:lytic polysaccharide monooxygenase [Aspergillus carbonarius ITEM 5010]|uniref:Lytic polysaccharide monooxygenase n=1 Tax=Aspergillus carbonarius (strain ITEM 5010) TaxID=602072 RepID=A0A1R3RIJ2_ASPC5|nr:lytic polysaccharide monooxygenase [Aspergillus carbonarius ITEM 5010]